MRVLKPEYLMNEVRRAKRVATQKVSAHHNAQLNYCRINRKMKFTDVNFDNKKVPEFNR